MWIVILALLIAVNAIELFLFWSDKRRARAGLRRVPEADLLGLALMGGSPAAFLGRQLFRHKTRKQPFSTYLALILMIQIGGVAGWLIA